MISIKRLVKRLIRKFDFYFQCLGVSVVFQLVTEVTYWDSLGNNSGSYGSVEISELPTQWKGKFEGEGCL